MASKTLDELVKEVDALSIDEQLRLAAYVVERARLRSAVPRRKWSDLRGIVQGMESGEDVQEWVTRTRRESDERRDLGSKES